MSKPTNLIVDTKIYNKMMNTAMTLVERIQEKQGNEKEIITVEEADFANAFIAYAKEIKKAWEIQKEE